jgi:hypothetical protein
MNNPRQRIAMHTEWTSRVVFSNMACEEDLNKKLDDLKENGFEFTGMHVVGNALVLMGKRLSPMPDATAVGSPHPATQAVQQLEVTYFWYGLDPLERVWKVNSSKVPTLDKAMFLLRQDMIKPDRKPISISITSVTLYSLEDLEKIYGQSFKKS